MFGLFKKNKIDIIEIKSPLTGRIISLKEVPDEVFSSKMMGDGIAIIPENNIVVSPIDGEVVMIMNESKHALAIGHKSGIQILIHVGIDTVSLNGEGFELLTSLNKSVKVGTPLIKFNQEVLKSKGVLATTMLIVAEPLEYTKSSENTGIEATCGIDTILVYKKA